METEATTVESAEPKWCPLTKKQRRILGVLVEKAKTTPDAYPLTLNALTTGCNQKSNRSPQMSLDTYEVEEVLEELRVLGAVVEVAGSGRVSKFKHLLYAWLGVEKAELAVMAELLLRGPQTVGELRGRAARMEPISDVATLRPILDALIDKRLVLSLTPEGRGQVVTHNLFPTDELNRVRETFAQGAVESQTAAAAPPVPNPRTASGDSQAPIPASGSSVNQELEPLREEINQLRTEIARMQRDIEDLWKHVN